MLNLWLALGYLAVVPLLSLALTYFGFDFRAVEPMGVLLVAFWPIGMPILLLVWGCMGAARLGARWRDEALAKKEKRLALMAAEARERLWLQNERLARAENEADQWRSMAAKRSEYR